MVTLQLIRMVQPTRECIYSVSHMRPYKQISECEFIEKYADSARAILVSFEDDGISNPQRVTAYACGLDCWYIAIEGVPDGA